MKYFVRMEFFCGLLKRNQTLARLCHFATLPIRHHRHGRSIKKLVKSFQFLINIRLQAIGHLSDHQLSLSIVELRFDWPLISYSINLNCPKWISHILSNSPIGHCWRSNKQGDCQTWSSSLLDWTSFHSLMVWAKSTWHKGSLTWNRDIFEDCKNA